MVVAAFGLKADGILVVGAAPNGLPTPQVPDLSVSDLGALLLPADLRFANGTTTRVYREPWPSTSPLPAAAGRSAHSATD